MRGNNVNESGRARKKKREKKGEKKIGENGKTREQAFRGNVSTVTTSGMSVLMSENSVHADEREECRVQAENKGCAAYRRPYTRISRERDTF